MEGKDVVIATDQELNASPDPNSARYQLCAFADGPEGTEEIMVYGDDGTGIILSKDRALLIAEAIIQHVR